MAIYHLHAKIIKRSKGHSIIAAAAYRSGECLQDKSTKQSYDYTKKRGVVYSKIMVPENAPGWASNRARLWNKVNESEIRRDAQLARDIVIALPKELDEDEQIALVEEFCRQCFTDHGMVADINIHNDNPENPHAHILLTTRTIDREGFGPKDRQWNKKALLVQWRETWARLANERLAKNNYTVTIDHRPLKEQGIDRKPQEHIGKYVTHAGRKDQASPRAKNTNQKLIDPDPDSRNTFTRLEVAPDGDCGYTAFGITREQAHQQLFDYLTSDRNELIVQRLINVVAQQLVIDESFIDYLIEQGINDGRLRAAYDEYQATMGQANTLAITNLQRHAHNIAIIQGYLNYDIRDRRIQNGWAHPAILQLLAHIQGIELYIWQLTDSGQLQPHEQILYRQYRPDNATQRTDLLFVNGNHFERLDREPDKDAPDSGRKRSRDEYDSDSDTPFADEQERESLSPSRKRSRFELFSSQESIEINDNIQASPSPTRKRSRNEHDSDSNMPFADEQERESLSHTRKRPRYDFDSEEKNDDSSTPSSP